MKHYNVYRQHGILSLVGQVAVRPGQSALEAASNRFDIEHPVIAQLDAKGVEIKFPPINSVVNEPI